MNRPRQIAVVTGSRAEYGLLFPVMKAIEAHPALTLRVCVTGTHLLPPAMTVDEVKQSFTIHAAIPMQVANRTGRIADSLALGQGVYRFAQYFSEHPPDVVLLLGDRIEAFAAASAAAIGGIRVAHMHGGDLAEGIADDSIRHAITKLVHIHLPATVRAAERLIAMGEEPIRTHLVGSPALDALPGMPAIGDGAYEALGSPEIVILLHPDDPDDAVMEERMSC